MGYSEKKWNAIKLETTKILQWYASQRKELSYRELSDKINLAKFDPYDPIFAKLLEDISVTEYSNNRGMLSVIVGNKENNCMPGSGFFKLAKSLNPRKFKDSMQFWVAESNKVKDYWSANYK